MRNTLSRRDFIKSAAAGSAALSMGCEAPETKDNLTSPNVLFIAIDDLNDWIGCLGGHPDVKTPHLDRLAARSVLFTNAHCAAPACNPSRAALMTGIRPSTSGVYSNNQPFRKSEVLQDAVTMPTHFMQNGYHALGSGKIYHGVFPDPPSWNEYWPSMMTTRPRDPMPENPPINGIPNTAHFDWGPVDVSADEMGDRQVAEWVSGQLAQRREKPFFLACGFYRPHLPWYVPKKYFDMYPPDEITLPNVKEDDLDDVPPIARKIARPDRDHANVLKYKQWRKAVQGYLASISFADDCVGKVIDALDASPHHDNTVIALWSDHGWHLGEKLHWRKFALWEEATHNVLMFSGPGVRQGGRCDAPVNLLDIYPTLIDLCGLQKRNEIEGRSLMTLLMNPNASWDYPTLTTHGRNSHSIRSKRWRYIRYSDGSEELYDRDSDEMEWNNLAGDPQYSEVKTELAGWMPDINRENSPGETAEEKKQRMKEMDIQLP